VSLLRRHADGFDPHDLGAAGVTAVLGAAELAAAGQAPRRGARLRRRGSRTSSTSPAPPGASPSMRLGVSPRATTALLAAAKAWAWLTGYDSLTPDHVQAMLLPVWRHRVQLRPEAELEGVSVDAVLRSIVQQVQVPL
jgi:MoxR-like ATPase